MSEPRRPDDDLVSAVLDGEATPGEEARVRADPVLADRLAEFARVRRMVGGPVDPVDDAARDLVVGRAVAAAGVEEDVGADVIGLDRARDRRGADRSRRVVIAAAAVVGALALAGGLLSLADDDGSVDQAGGTADEAADAATGDVGVPELDLGAVDDPETLRRRINEGTGLAERGGAQGEDPADGAEAESGTAAGPPDGGPPEAGPTALTVEDCAIRLLETRPQLIGQLAQGTVTYQGTDAYVLAYNDADLGAAVGIVTSTADCTVLAEVTL
jgi:hypothetical protein